MVGACVSKRRFGQESLIATMVRMECRGEHLNVVPLSRFRRPPLKLQRLLLVFQLQWTTGTSSMFTMVTLQASLNAVVGLRKSTLAIIEVLVYRGTKTVQQRY